VVSSQKLVVAVVIGWACVVPVASLAGSYPQIGGGPGHLGVASGGGPTDLSSPRLAAGPDLFWVNQSGVAVAGSRVVGLTEFEDATGVHMGVVAVNEFDGQIAWTAPVPDLVYDSWSPPSIDPVTAVVVVASDDQVTGLSLWDGHQVWYRNAAAGKVFVNASPTIDGGVAYIAEFGYGSTLYAIDTTSGQLKWQAAVGNIEGNNTVAVNTTRVMIVTSDGRFRTFNRLTGAADVNVLIPDRAFGFFGGVAAEDGAAYTVSYAFGPRYGSTRLFKIDPANGVVIWSVVAPRTDTIPVIAGNRVLVSGGDDYVRMHDGTDAASLWAFDKASGQKLWSTGLAGGWTCQPVYVDGIVYVPTLSGYGSAPMSGVLYAFDADLTPSNPGFTIDSTDQIACSVSVADGNVYGTGLYGLVAIGRSPLAGDINGDGAVDVVDLLMLVDHWASVVGDPNYHVDADFNGDGSVDVVDLLTMVENWGSVSGGLAVPVVYDHAADGRLDETDLRVILQALGE
jgi:outer membrane protein assembly factor BamB